MGEYWKPVNVTRKEFIHPHRVGNGLKLLEWNHAGSHVSKIIAERWSPSDDVRAVSDYGNCVQLSGVRGGEDVGWQDLDNDGDSSPEEEAELAAEYGPFRYRMISEEWPAKPTELQTAHEALKRVRALLDKWKADAETAPDSLLVDDPGLVGVTCREFFRTQTSAFSRELLAALGEP